MCSKLPQRAKLLKPVAKNYQKAFLHNLGLRLKKRFNIYNNFALSLISFQCPYTPYYTHA